MSVLYWITLQSQLLHGISWIYGVLSLMILHFNFVNYFYALFLVAFYYALLFYSFLYFLKMVVIFRFTYQIMGFNISSVPKKCMSMCFSLSFNLFGIMVFGRFVVNTYLFVILCLTWNGSFFILPFVCSFLNILKAFLENTGCKMQLMFKKTIFV